MSILCWNVTNWVWMQYDSKTSVIFTYHKLRREQLSSLVSRDDFCVEWCKWRSKPKHGYFLSTFQNSMNDTSLAFLICNLSYLSAKPAHFLKGVFLYFIMDTLLNSEPRRKILVLIVFHCIGPQINCHSTKNSLHKNNNRIMPNKNDVKYYTNLQ